MTGRAGPAAEGGAPPGPALSLGPAPAPAASNLAADNIVCTPQQAVYTRGPHNYIQQITCNMDYNYCFPNRILPPESRPLPRHPLDSVTLASVTRPPEQRHGLAEKFPLDDLYRAL